MDDRGAACADEPGAAHLALSGDLGGFALCGRGEPIAGRVRMIRSEPGFTPYYALVGEDAARLAYLAEITLPGQDAATLPAGLPLRVEFGR